LIRTMLDLVKEVKRATTYIEGVDRETRTV